MNLLKPSDQKTSVTEIDPKNLLDKGIRNLIIDLEGTLVPRETWAPAPETREWIKGVKSAGLKIILLSNTIFFRRSKEISENLGLPILCAAFKPLPFSFLKAVKLLSGSYSETAVIGDQLFMDVLGGNLLGLHTILVKPISTSKNPLRKFMRWMESRFVK